MRTLGQDTLANQKPGCYWIITTVCVRDGLWQFVKASKEYFIHHQKHFAF